MSAPAIVEGFRLSPQQRRLWMLQQDDASSFRAQLVLLLEGELQIHDLRAALQQVCARHESLRSTFSRLPGVLLPIQSVVDDLDISWSTVEINVSELEGLLAAERRREFDLEYGPLVHATLYVLSPAHHVLSIAVPALCADRHTLNNLFSEFCQRYGLTIKGEDEPFQYLQFAEWQNTLADEPDAREGKEYWSKKDLTAASSVRLPGQPRNERCGEANSVNASLSAETVAQIEAVATRFETTSANVLLAAWQALLWRLTRRLIVIGNVCHGRSYDLLNDAFGLFARALPSYCRFEDGLSFAEVIAQITAGEREATEWQDYFELGQTTDGAASHFTFGYEYAELPAAQTARGVQISVFHRHSGIERFRLKLSNISNRELEFEYDEAAFSEVTVSHIAEQFQTLLIAILADPDGLVDDFEIVSDAEREQIVFTWNQTQREYELGHCLHELFEQQASRTPDAPAVVYKDSGLTFQQLNERANRVAHRLQAQGVGPEIPVGLCVERSLEMIVGLLGILKAGGAYLPIDPRNPDKRINQVLKDGGATLLLTQSHLATRQIEPDIRLIELDGDFASESVRNPSSTVTPKNLAYIIYTSGSTGRPKGVMIQHASAVNLAAGLRDELYADLGPALKVGLSAPLAFDASVKQWLQLLSGHTLYLLPEELRLDAAQLRAYLDQHVLDVLECTPSQLKLLLAAKFSDTNWNKPKMMLIGGEAVDESLWSQLAAEPQTRFENVYGPTECTVDTTSATISAHASPTIGRPLPNVQVYILDENLKPAGVHITGELYVGGSGVGRGYLNHPDLTAERFVPDFLSGKEGARLYRTGDLARYLPDGTIEFLGRNDSQVKIRGHRIELGEIEAIVRQHEQVRSAVVIAREDRPNEQRLVAYVVPKEKLDVGEIRQLVSERLPEYMALSFVVVLDQLPLTRNGKVDLKALPKPESVQIAPVARYVAPRNEIEQIVTSVWQEALGVEQIGINDNFFEVGGHSLLMVQVHSKLSDLFESKLSIAEMFAKPTISALAEHLGNGKGHKAGLQSAATRAERRKQAAARRKSSS